MFSTRKQKTDSIPETTDSIREAIERAKAKRDELANEFDERYGPNALADAELHGITVSASDREALAGKVRVQEETVAALEARLAVVREAKREAEKAGRRERHDELVNKRQCTAASADAKWREWDKLEHEIRVIDAELAFLRSWDD